MKEARDQFENQWQSTFEGAEASPPGHVWNSIDAALASQREAGYKKKIIFFKWVAAASVFIAVMSATLVWHANNGDISQLALSETPVKSLESSSESLNKPSEQSTLSTNGNSITPESGHTLNETQSEHSDSKNNAEGVEKDIESPTMGSEKSNTSLVAIGGDDGAGTGRPGGKKSLSQSETSTQAFVLAQQLDESEKSTKNSYVENFNSSNEKRVYLVLIQDIASKALAHQGTIMEPWTAEFLYLVPDLSAGKSKEPFKAFDMWAGLSVSSGSFNPGTNNAGDFGLSADALDSEGLGVAAYSTNQSSIPSEVGSSFSAGLNFGTMVSEKIVISTGLHYLNLSSTSSSNLIVTDPNSNESLALFSSDVSNTALQDGVRDGSLVVSEEQVDFVNRFNYLSIPLKAGYVMLDTKFNVILNTGISSNFLVSNRIESDNSTVALFNKNTNDEIYKPVYFNLLTSIEFGYRFKEKYYFSLEPNYRKAISSFTNDESSYTGKPTNLGVSVGLKYIF